MIAIFAGYFRRNFMAWKCSAAREKLKSFNPGPRLDMRISLVTFSSARRFLIDVLILFWRENARSAGTLDTGIVLAILASFAQSGKIFRRARSRGFVPRQIRSS